MFCRKVLNNVSVLLGLLVIGYGKLNPLRRVKIRVPHPQCLFSKCNMLNTIAMGETLEYCINYVELFVKGLNPNLLECERFNSSNEVFR